MSGYTLVALVIIGVWALVMGACVMAHREPRPVRRTLVGTDTHGHRWVATRTGPSAQLTARLTRDGRPWVDALGPATLAQLTVRYGIRWARG